MGPLLPRNSKRRKRATDLPSLMANAHYRAVQRSGSPSNRCPLQAFRRSLSSFVQGGFRARTAHSGAFNSPANHPVLSDFIGSVEIVSLSTCSHLLHSNVRRS
jgi:hypothetical protein